MNNIERRKGIEKFTSTDGKEHVVALNYTKNGRNFVITIEKKIFEKREDGTCVECTQRDDDNDVLFECVKPPKTDIIDRER